MKKGGFGRFSSRFWEHYWPRAVHSVDTFAFICPPVHKINDMTPVSSLSARIVLLLAALVLAAPAMAQNRVYRCGNEYTNQIQGRTDCKPVDGGNITVIQGTRPAPAAARTPGPARPAAATPATVRPQSAAQVNAAEQRARDADARAILERELRRAEARQADLEAEYKDGEPDKIGGEARNYQKYLDRTAELKASIERNQSDIEGIRRELARLPSP